jgi:hypothetical protein
VGEIKAKMVNVIKEIKKRTNGISEEEITNHIYHWVAKISWNDSLRNKVMVSDY